MSTTIEACLRVSRSRRHPAVRAALAFSGGFALALSLAVSGFHASTLSAAEFETERYHLVGTIGEKAVQVSLSILDEPLPGKDEAAPDASFQRLAGRYAYEKHGLSLSLEGRIGEDGSFTLIESPPPRYDAPDDVRPTGRIQGQAVVSKGPRVHRWLEARGTWSAPDGTRPLPFAWRVVADYISLSAGSPGDWAFCVEYPRFRDPEAKLVPLNCLIAREVLEIYEHESRTMPGIDRNETEGIRRMELSWDVEFVSRSLFSLALTTRFDVGGASSTIMVEERHYIDDPKDVRRLKLGELFIGGKIPWDRIHAECLADLRRQRVSDVVEGLVTTIPRRHLEAFTVLPAGLAIRIEPFVVGPTALGVVTALVPWKTLEDSILEKGPAGRFIEKRS